MEEVHLGVQDAFGGVFAQQKARDRLVAAFGAVIEAEVGENDSEGIVAAKNLRLSLDVRLQNSCAYADMRAYTVGCTPNHMPTFGFISALF